MKGLQELGYQRPDPDGLVSLRIHGVTVPFVRELKELGYEPPPSLDELVSMRIHGASADFVRALRGLGYERVPVDDLVSMRIHGVSPEFIRTEVGQSPRIDPRIPSPTGLFSSHPGSARTSPSSGSRGPRRAAVSA